MKLDKVRINEKFSDIQTAIERLMQFYEMDREAFISNKDSIHIARSHLLIAAEAVINICYHISAKMLKRTSAEYGSCLETLNEHSFISKELSQYLIRLVGLRNKMVHRYEEIDYGFLYDNFKLIAENLQKFIDEISLLLETK